MKTNMIKSTSTVRIAELEKESTFYHCINYRNVCTYGPPKIVTTVFEEKDVPYVHFIIGINFFTNKNSMHMMCMDIVIYECKDVVEKFICFQR